MTKTELDFESGSDSSSDEGVTSKLSINKKFASEYEKRKRQQELINAVKDGEDTDESDHSSSDESEDEDAELLTDKVDLQILKTIQALRTKDESIYNKDQKFFSDEGMDSSSSSSSSTKKKKKKKKVYKDIVREQILKKMNNDKDASDEEDSDEDVAKKRNIEKMYKLEYDEEQKAIRAEFLDDGEMSDADDQWLRKKSKGPDSTINDYQIAKEREDTLAALMATSSTPLIDPKGEVEDGEKFLLDFITNKRWVDPDDRDTDEDHDVDHEKHNDIDDGHDSDASLEDLERTDEFESRYNFRFEEANENSGAGLSVVGYSRTALSDNIRRKDDSRKKKREERKERKATERKAKEERLKRLKNAKKEQLEERINQIKSVLGESFGEEDNNIANRDIDEELVAKLMEGDFDEEKYEDLMNKLYNDDFYQKEDTEWKTDCDVRNSLKNAADHQIHETGLDIDDEEADAIYDDGAAEFPDEENYTDMYEDDINDEPIHLSDTKESTLEKKLKQKMLDELYKLDYEDIIGDMPTRFKYRQVQPNRYGLTPEEILCARDSTLKQFVSLKRMAPYDEGGEYIPGTKKRKRFREMLKADYKEMNGVTSENAKHNENENEESDKKKKKRRQKKDKKKESNNDSVKVVKEVSGLKEQIENKKKIYTTTSNVKEIKEKDLTKKRKKSGHEKKERSKEKSIEGVSSSRLTSYGL